MKPILFLDINGVLLTGRAWGMPSNAAARLLIKSDPGLAASLVIFDRVAVELVNRLCTVTDAKVVIASDWLHRHGENQTRGKLIEQGIDPRHIHADCCRLLGKEPRHMAYAISEWRRSHRIALRPCGPVAAGIDAVTPDAMGRSNADHANREAELNIGPFVVLGAQALHWNHMLATVEDGITGEVYRIACRALGGADPDMGVHSVLDADWQRVLGAFGGRAVQAAHFLDGGRNEWWSNAVADGGPLPEECWLRLAEELEQALPVAKANMDF